MDSFISWIGGKKLLRKELLAAIPQTKIDSYVEVFGGAAWLLFAKEQHANLEVYNDLDSELVNLFKCVKHHPEELERSLLLLNSRELFADLKAKKNLRGQTDIQRAANMFMLIRTSYGSDRSSFGCARKALLHGVKRFDEIHERLINVLVENKPYDKLIAHYDSANAFFYCDPPYVGTEEFYEVSFTSEDHTNLHRILTSIKGHFMLSYNDCPFICNLYKDYNINHVTRNNNLAARTKPKQYAEVIITNY